MRSKFFTPIVNRLILLVGQLVILSVCISHLSHIYRVDIRPDKEITKIYKQTDCFIINKRLLSKDKSETYRADFLISYRVNEVQYRHWVSGNGLDNSFFKNKEKEEAQLTQFNRGGTYKCWYNPDDPQAAVLILRQDWSSIYHLIIPGVIGILVLYFMLRNLVKLWRLTGK